MKKLNVLQMENLQGGIYQMPCAMVWAAVGFILAGGIAPIGISDIKRCI